MKTVFTKRLFSIASKLDAAGLYSAADKIDTIAIKLAADEPIKDPYDGKIQELIASISRVEGPTRKLTLQNIFNTYAEYTSKYANSPGADYNKVRENGDRLGILGRELMSADSYKAPAELDPGASGLPDSEKKKTEKANPKADEKKAPKANLGASMKETQNLVNSYIDATGKGSPKLEINGKPGDAATWNKIKELWPEWWNGKNPKFKNYTQLNKWLSDAASRKPSDAKSEAKEPASPIDDAVWHSLRPALQKFLAAYPYEQRADPEDLVEEYGSTTKQNITAKMQLFLDNPNLATIGVVKQTVSGALEKIKLRDPKAAIALLNGSIPALQKAKERTKALG